MSARGSNAAASATSADVTEVDFSTEEHNYRVWDGRKRGHYEVWYITLNHRASNTGYWIRYTLESPVDGHGEPYAQLWFAFFDANDPSRNFAINRKRPIETLLATAYPFRVSIGDATLTHASASGAMSGDGHEVSWDLSWVPYPAIHRHLPPVMYRRNGLGDTTVLTPNINVPIRGVVRVDGHAYELDGEPGGQTHLWGRKHAHAWAWGHCNAFEDRPDVSFEALTAVLKRRGVVLPPLTILSLYMDGEALRWNGFRHTLLTRASYGTGRYQFSARNTRTRVEGEYTCRPADMIVANYEDPDGEPSYCANTEVADLRITVYERSGLLSRWRERARLVAPKRGHFEIGSRERDPAIDNTHILVD